MHTQSLPTLETTMFKIDREHNNRDKKAALLITGRLYKTKEDNLASCSIKAGL
jgi:hypothetical protein